MGIGKIIEEDMRLQEFVERLISYTFNSAISGDGFLEDICEEMDITEEGAYYLYEQLGYELDK